MGSSRDEKNKNNDQPQMIKYLPPHFDPQSLKENGKLLDEKTISRIKEELKNPTRPELINYIKTRLNNQPYGRYSKKLFDVPYGIINGKNSLYGIYNQNGQKETALPGGSGKIKSAQCFATTEVYSLKTQLLENNIKKNIFHQEHKNLSTLNLTREPIMSRTNKNGVPKGDLLMKHAKGEELFSLFVKRRQNSALNMTDLTWLEACKKIMEEVIKNKTFLHSDIKPDNFIYQIDTGEAHLVDWAVAKQKEEKIQCGYRQIPIEGYAAPETFRYSYTEKSEVFALGTLLQMTLYNCYVKQPGYDARQYSPPIFSRGKKTLLEEYPNQQYEQSSGKYTTIDEFFAQMHHYQPALRPTREEVLYFFTSVYEHYFGQELYTMPSLPTTDNGLKGYVITKDSNQQPALFFISPNKVPDKLNINAETLRLLLPSLDYSYVFQTEHIAPSLIKNKLPITELSHLNDEIAKYPKPPLIPADFYMTSLEVRQIEINEREQEKNRMKNINATLTLTFFKPSKKRLREEPTRTNKIAAPKT